jgi:acyl-CoA thioester hydrolase
MFTSTYRVYYEDTDAGGVVYHANYLKFFERGRTDFLREKGINQSKLVEEKGILFVVKKCEIEYKSAGKLDDILRVETIVAEVRKASIEMEQKIFRDSDDCLLTECKLLIACVNKNGMRPTKIPEGLEF